MTVRRPMTQRMIAERVGVSVTTVSRVLNQDEAQPERWASPETIAAILEAAKEGGYRRNPHAASLRTARSNLIGVLVPRLQDFVLATIYEGIDEAAAEHGVSTFVTNSMDDPALQRTRTQSMLDRRVDGLIFGDAHYGDPFLDELEAQEIPFVLTSRRSGDHLAVTCDDLEGGRLVARHLLELGRTKIAVIAGLPFASTGLERTRGLVDEVRAAGFDIPDRWIIQNGFDAAAGRAAAERIFAAEPYPDAVFATNDFAAIGAMGVLRDKGLRIPEDVALVGYNDTPLAESITISLTTVRSPMHQMGRVALETLLDLIAGHQVASQRLMPELIVRGSTVGDEAKREPGAV
ncbi:LacI family DNA-binding transcriptional regulator [Microbacterium sp. ASV49]|uniref:LacI family DNA-binding transcriptional regulator n=1 Tax=Microbacterium candidum TaxID=3041922 RepID=A0ABT7MVC9_9MICO|nr:LacI family DNA-binding transcriptional regulator [Microbacterium sp. ASV49]MDL9978415.1 LacI family DNA-binding transcriptional regulator [Microbacterium sp. ASV49]